MKLPDSPDNVWTIYVDLGKGVDAPHEQFKRLVNGVGTSPHMAIMGQSGSGKTRIMKEVLKQIHNQTGAPVILLDLGKGDLALRFPLKFMFHGKHPKPVGEER